LRDLFGWKILFLMEAEHLNRFERSYKRLNTSASLALTPQQWVLIVVAFGSVALSDLTGYPEVRVLPIVVFVIEGGYDLWRTRGSSWRRVLMLGAICLATYLAFSRFKL
jgi:hypothetical protein